MRTISSDLADVQKVRSPRARATVTVEARGQNPSAPALAWAEVVGNAGQSGFKPTTAVGLANGNILKFQVDTASVVNKYTVTNPHLAASWSGLTPVSVVAASALSLAAVRVLGTSAIRLWYINLSNNVLFIDSSDNGATWGSATTVYSGGNATIDLVACYIDNGVTANGSWFFGFSTESAGTYTPRFGYYDGASWVTHAYDPDWRAAGIDAYGAENEQHRCLVSRTRGKGAGKLRILEKLGATYVNETDVDQTQGGLFGVELTYYRFCQLPEAGCMLGVAGESAHGSGAFLGIAGLFYATDHLVDEPIILPSIEAVKGQPYACLCSVGDDVYLVGDTVVWRGAAQAATGTTIDVIRYTYDDHQLTIEFAAGIAALSVGQILAVKRTLSFNTKTGNETFRAIIVRVEQGTDGVRVVALDALGWLGSARCRRPSILNDGTAAGVAIVMRKLGARFGIAVGRDNSDLENEAVMPFTLAPAESLRGAAFRIGSQADYYLVPDNSGAFKLTLIVPGDSDGGDYDDTAQVYGAGATQQPIAKAAVISDYRVLAFSYVLGTYSTDPEDGAALEMAAGRVVPNTRPLSYSITNSRYNTTTRVELAAVAEAARQKMLPIAGMIEGQANLALEIYDVVAVTEPLLGWSAKQFRVRRIDERYDRGLLTQKVYLGDV